MTALIGLLAGTLFGIGLALSGMTDTNRVLGFLDITGAWLPGLAFVMGGAVVVTSLAFPLLRRRGRPLLDSAFHLPQRRDIDLRLLLGAALFGIGWGLYGYCPGPAIASLLYGNTDSIAFLGAMVAGMFVSSRVTGP